MLGKVSPALPAAGSSVSHVYCSKGTFTVTLTVTNQEAAKTMSQFQITVV
jgi:PKD repeat protein